MTAAAEGGRRSDLVAGTLANAIEWYDFAVFGAMASVVSVVLLGTGSEVTHLGLVFALFGTSFLARPVGALLIGVRADRFGRRRALSSMVLLMTAATVAIGLMPTWSTVGWVAPVALVALRLVQGFASGGEISTSIAFLVESGRRSRWGLYAGWHTATVALGIAAGIAVAAVVTSTMSREALESWGWRLPFLLALPLGLVGLLLRARNEDTPDFEALPRGRSGTSVAHVYRTHRATVGAGLLVVGLLAATFNLWFLFLPAYLAGEGIQSLSQGLAAATLGLVAAAVSGPLFGLLSDRTGRSVVLCGAVIALAVLAVPLYRAATSGSWAALAAADILVGIVLGAFVIGGYLAEAFPVEVRATGIALSYGFGTAVLGGTAPWIGTVLVRHDAALGVPAYLLLLSGLSLVALLVARYPLRVRPTLSPAREGGEHGHDDAGVSPPAGQR